MNQEDDQGVIENIRILAFWEGLSVDTVLTGLNVKGTMFLVKLLHLTDSVPGGRWSDIQS